MKSKKNDENTRPSTRVHKISEHRAENQRGSTNSSPDTPGILFLGNGPLAESALAVLKRHFRIKFHAHSRDDLETLCALKRTDPELPAVLASFGVMLKPAVLELFEPAGIINLHPSLLPQYRGATPIESALLAGDTELGISVMKITAEMDAGPIYWQKAMHFAEDIPKSEIYRQLAEAGAEWLSQNLFNLPMPEPQDDSSATFTRMLKKTDGVLDPAGKTAAELARIVRAYASFPKAKFTFGAEYGNATCTLLRAHASATQPGKGELFLPCAGNTFLVIDELQPESRRAMSAESFRNGYRREGPWF